jgi:hypothetical protein
MDRIKSLITMTRHHERCAFRLDYFFLVSIWKLNLMGAHNVGSETAVQNNSVPNYLIATFLAESTFSILLPPALQKCESHRAKKEVSHANILAAGAGIDGSKLTSDERDDSRDSPRRLGRS